LKIGARSLAAHPSNAAPIIRSTRAARNNDIGVAVLD
jgi:hypothetical protein